MLFILGTQYLCLGVLRFVYRWGMRLGTRHKPRESCCAHLVGIQITSTWLPKYSLPNSTQMISRSDPESWICERILAAPALELDLLARTSGFTGIRAHKTRCVGFSVSIVFFVFQNHISISSGLFCMLNSKFLDSRKMSVRFWYPEQLTPTCLWSLVDLSIHPSFPLSTCPFFPLFICPSFPLSICPMFFVHPSFPFSICPFVHLSISSLCLFVRVRVCLSISLWALCEPPCGENACANGISGYNADTHSSFLGPLASNWFFFFKTMHSAA